MIQRENGKNIDQNYEDQLLSNPNLLFTPWAYALLKACIDLYYLEECQYWLPIVIKNGNLV